MNSPFFAHALPMLIGSVPMDDHTEATTLVFNYTPDTPLWVQLPRYKAEGMVEQFSDGIPGLVRTAEKVYVNTASETFEQEVLEFFEAYIGVAEGNVDVDGSRFVLTDEKRKGFDALLRHLDNQNGSPYVIKGQVTGPVTFGTGMTDQDDKAIFYDDQLKDILVKHLALNAGWQARTFSKYGGKPIVFIDEPALAGFGTSAYITLTREDVTSSINEITQAIHQEGGLAGVHVCANTQWDILLDTDINIISFDAYTYFDRFILYPKQVKSFIDRGGILAWGIVPTLEPDDIQKESVESLLERFNAQAAQIEALGISRDTLLRQSFITPSCGTGPLSFDMAKRVMELTRDLSMVIREDG